MKKSGRKCKYEKSIVEKAVKLYLESELTLEEVAEKLSISIGALRYEIYKKRKE